MKAICTKCPCLQDWTNEGYDATCGLGYKIEEIRGVGFRSNDCELIVIETKGGPIFPEKDEEK